MLLSYWEGLALANCFPSKGCAKHVASVESLSTAVSHESSCRLGSVAESADWQLSGSKAVQPDQRYKCAAFLSLTQKTKSRLNTRLGVGGYFSRHAIYIANHDT